MEAKVVVLGPQHKEAKKIFKCSSDILNKYLSHFALQDQQKKLSVCFVLEDAQNDIIGFYTLSATSIDAKQLLDEHLLGFHTHYRTLPAILIGRFAIDRAFEGKGFGKKLLADALKRCAKQAEQIGACAVFVEPKDKVAQDFYQKFGFQKLEQQQKMFIPIKQLVAAFRGFH